MVVQQSIRIPNDLYGTDLMSGHALKKRYTRPLVSECLKVVRNDLKTSHNLIVAKRKLNLIFRSKFVPELAISPGD